MVVKTEDIIILIYLFILHFQISEYYKNFVKVREKKKKQTDFQNSV